MRAAVGAPIGAFFRLPAAVRMAALLAGVVALGAAVLSWDAGRWAAGEIGIDSQLTGLWPVVVDGMIACGTVGVVVVREPLRTRAYVWGVLGAGLAISIWANGAHAPAGGPVLWGALELHRAGSAVPALALALALHVLVIVGRATRPAPVAAREASERGKRGARRARPRRTAEARLGALLDGAEQLPTTRELAGQLGVSPGHVRKVRARLQREETAA